MRRRLELAVLLCCTAPVCAQSDVSDPVAPAITTQSTLVTVPALVRDKAGAIVFTLKAEDFHLTDNGVEQKLRLEEDTDGQPLALVVLVENGSDGALKLDEYARLPTLVDNFVGAVPHRIAVVTFDGAPTVVQPFTEDEDKTDRALRHIEAGDRRAAILDALSFSVDLLRQQPKNYRRAILLISETVDHGSTSKLGDAIRAVSDTNTAIYAVAFSSSRSNAKREGPKTLGQNQMRGPLAIPLPGISSDKPQDPGPAHGCFSRDPNDPYVDLEEKPIEQVWDCLSLLAPPLRLAKIAFLVAVNGIQKNVPETVTRMTGGEYFVFHNQKGFEQELIALANHVPNRYVLSFQPHLPHSGPHAIKLTLPDYPQLQINARETYWAEGAGQSPAK